jgi:O-antigen/teichoic acid export membrane protein
MIKTLRAMWQDKLLRGIIKNSSYLFSSNSIAIVLSMLQGIFAARLLGATNFGILAGVILPVASDIHRLVSFRMSEPVVKYLNQFLAEGRKDRAAATVKGAMLVEALVTALAYGVLVLAAPLAARYLAKDPQTSSLFLLYGTFLFSFAVYETATGVLQAWNKFNQLAVVRLAQSGVTAALIFTAFLTHGGPLEVLLAYLVGKVLEGLTVAILALRLVKRELGSDWWRASLKLMPERRELGRFALSTNLQGTLNLIFRDSETLLISLLRSPAEAGYFRIALAVINLVTLPVDPFIAPTYREITRTIAERNFDLTRRLLKRVSIIAGTWTLGAGGVLTLAGYWLVPLMYGAEFRPAYPALVLLLVGYGFANILHWNRPLLLALDKPAFPIKSAAAAGSIKTLLTFIVVPIYGYLAEAAILSAYFLSSIGLNVWRGRREIATQEAKDAAPAEAGSA